MEAMTTGTKIRPAKGTTKRFNVVGRAVSDGLARMVDIAPPHITVFTEESDWAFLGGDFRDAIDSLIASDERLQPPLPFDEDEDLVEAK